MQNNAEKLQTFQPFFLQNNCMGEKRNCRFSDYEKKLTLPASSAPPLRRSTQIPTPGVSGGTNPPTHPEKSNPLTPPQGGHAAVHETVHSSCPRGTRPLGTRVPSLVEQILANHRPGPPPVKFTVIIHQGRTLCQ